MTDLTGQLYELCSGQGAPTFKDPPTVHSLTHDAFLKEAYRIVSFPLGSVSVL